MYEPAVTTSPSLSLDVAFTIDSIRHRFQVPGLGVGGEQ